MSRAIFTVVVFTVVGCLLFTIPLAAQQPPDSPGTPTPGARGRGQFSGRSSSSSRTEASAPTDASATGKLITLEVLIASPNETIAEPSAAKILELDKASKLQSAVRLHLAALENQSASVQFKELVARVTGRNTGRPGGPSMPNYTDVNVGTLAQAVSRVNDDGAVVTHLTIERSGVAAPPARPADAAEQTNVDLPSPVFTLSTQTTVRLKVGQPLLISGGRPSSKESGQTWIVVTASIGQDG